MLVTHVELIAVQIGDQLQHRRAIDHGGPQTAFAGRPPLAPASPALRRSPARPEPHRRRQGLAKGRPPCQRFLPAEAAPCPKSGGGVGHAGNQRSPIGGEGHRRNSSARGGWRCWNTTSLAAGQFHQLNRLVVFSDCRAANRQVPAVRGERHRYQPHISFGSVSFAAPSRGPKRSGAIYSPQ